MKQLNHTKYTKQISQFSFVYLQLLKLYPTEWGLLFFLNPIKNTKIYSIHYVISILTSRFENWSLSVNSLTINFLNVASA